MEGDVSRNLCSLISPLSDLFNHPLKKNHYELCEGASTLPSPGYMGVRRTRLFNPGLVPTERTLYRSQLTLISLVCKMILLLLIIHS